MLSAEVPLALGREGGERGSPESEDLPFASKSVPLAEGGNVLRRSFVAVLVVLPVLAACGGGSSTSVSTGAAAQPERAAIVVTRDCGKAVVVKRTDLPSGGTAMRALDTVADIQTDSGGKFVTAVEGVEQDTGKKLAWLYYINGKPAQKGATEIKLAPGDVEWWDLHNYEHECAVVPTEAK
jgi:hypothetical protein